MKDSCARVTEPRQYRTRSKEGTDSVRDVVRARPKQHFEDLLAGLRERNLLSDEQAATVQAMRRSAEGRAVPLASEHRIDDDLMALLAGGFAKGELGAPAIPYARRSD